MVLELNIVYMDCLRNGRKYTERNYVSTFEWGVWLPFSFNKSCDVNAGIEVGKKSY